ncbi:heterokaryon incompatibility protein-domain-containing protein [Clohesyomyces aquaticus]|uniref:Heterokaryon incompatibility protein-domain-containing protein n=1 Tax=Clohesyomyces aquaticus TaxID=1231657 RepID=A0A1Y1YC41_9PLEO|nr:heterokaryon incompatibility protein-domain-containing protein [Clohesyomyces aquaticus]
MPPATTHHHHPRHGSTSSDSDSDQVDDDRLEPYEYEPLQHPTSTRLLKLQPGGRKDQKIVCKLIEVDLDPDYTKEFLRIEELQKEAEARRKLKGEGTKAKQENPELNPAESGKAGHREKTVVKSYEALSWSWGQDDWDKRIEIDKDGLRYYFIVPETLIHAFSALKRKRRERTLWVDAICIDQENDDEKSQQVPMMSEIYGGSKSVCVWLGQGDEDSKMAFEFIKHEILKLEDFDKLCDNPTAAPKWNAMFSLMKRPWFSRRWIVQEIALAKDAQLYCGRSNIPWQDFADAVQLFVSVESATHRLSEVMRVNESFYHVPRWFEYMSKLGASLLVDATGTLFRYTKTLNREPGSLGTNGKMSTTNDRKLKLPDGRDRQALLSLEYLVSKMSIFQATNAHDIIYSLLAIAKDTNPVSRKKPFFVSETLRRWTIGRKFQARPYEVDYSKRYVDICAEFIEFAISQQPDKSRALDIICRPWAAEPKKEQPKKRGLEKAPGYAKESEVVEKLPSWIPQLSRASHDMILHADSVEKMGRINADPLVGLPDLNKRNYNAAGDMSPELYRIKIKKRPGYHSMEVFGFVLDKVEKVERDSQNGNIPKSWFELAGVDTSSFGQSNTDPASRDNWEEFWRTLVADRGQNGRNPPPYYARAFEMSLKKGLLSTGSLNTTDMIDHGRCSVVSEFFRRVQAVIWNRRMMRTQGRRLGTVDQDVQAGDLVCILHGCSVPVILRPIEKDVSIELRQDLSIEDEMLKEKAGWCCRRRLEELELRKQKAEKRKEKQNGHFSKAQDDSTPSVVAPSASLGKVAVGNSYPDAHDTIAGAEEHAKETRNGKTMGKDAGSAFHGEGKGLDASSRAGVDPMPSDGPKPEVHELGKSQGETAKGREKPVVKRKRSSLRTKGK